jgi:hypothetical protein
MKWHAQGQWQRPNGNLNGLRFFSPLIIVYALFVIKEKIGLYYIFLVGK